MEMGPIASSRCCATSEPHRHRHRHRRERAVPRGCSALGASGVVRASGGRSFKAISGVSKKETEASQRQEGILQCGRILRGKIKKNTTRELLRHHEANAESLGIRQVLQLQ